MVADQLWRSPELLRDSPVIGTVKGDVYAFGIILHEILGMMGPWGDTRVSDRGKSSINYGYTYDRPKL